MASPAQPASTSTRISSSSAFTIDETRYEPRAVLARHYHARASLSLVFSGSQRERVGRREHACTPLSVVFKTAEVDHSDHVELRGMHGLFVELAPATLDSLTHAVGVPADVARFADGPTSSLVRQLRHELRFRQAGAEFAIEGLVYELLASVARRGSSEDMLPRREDGWLARAREFVHGRFRERITLRDVATEVGVHPSHLARAFRAAHGRTVGEYVRELRVEHARRLLLDPTRTLSDIALEAGFADQAHLTRLVRRHMGTTPAQLRREAGEERREGSS